MIAVITFFMVIFLAGPHSGLLPSWLEGAVLVLGWLAVLIMPVLVARRVWRHFGKVEPPNCKATHQ
jgi:hydrogenase-4 membrane subunit HyfE